MKNLTITRESANRATEITWRNIKTLNQTGRSIDMRKTTSENRELFNSIIELSHLSTFCAVQFGEAVLEKSQDKLKIEHIFSASDQMQGSKDSHSIVGTRIKLGKKHSMEMQGKPCDAVELSFFINENKDEIKFGIALGRKKKKVIINTLDIFESNQDSFTAEEFWKRIENNFFDSIEIDGEVVDVIYAE